MAIQRFSAPNYAVFSFERNVVPAPLLYCTRINFKHHRPNTKTNAEYQSHILYAILHNISRSRICRCATNPYSYTYVRHKPLYRTARTPIYLSERSFAAIVISDFKIINKNLRGYCCRYVSDSRRHLMFFLDVVSSRDMYKSRNGNDAFRKRSPAAVGGLRYFLKRKTNTFRRAERARCSFDGNKCGRPSLVRFGCLVIGSKFISYAAAGH